MRMDKCSRCGLKKRDDRELMCYGCRRYASVASSLKFRQRMRSISKQQSDDATERFKKGIIPTIDSVTPLEKPLHRMSNSERRKAVNMKTYKVSLIEYVVASSRIEARKKAEVLFDMKRGENDKDIEVLRIDNDGKKGEESE